MNLKVEPIGCPTPGACSCNNSLVRAARIILKLRGCIDADITPEIVESLVQNELIFPIEATGGTR